MTTARLDGDGETLRRLLLRWGGAGLCVVAAHATAAFAVLNWPRLETAAGEPPAAVMIELAPLPAAPEVPEQELAVGPQSEMSDTSSPSEAKDEPVEKVEPDQPEPQPSETKPVTEPVDREIKTEVETEKLPQIDTAEAVLEAPKPPEPEKVEEEKPPEKPKKTEQKQKPQDKSKKAAQVTAAPKPLQAPRAKTNAAPSSGVSSSMSIATWRGMVVAHMNRRKRVPGGASGTSSVAFTIDRSGRVLSARLIRSSGNAALDREAVALAHRASPVPAPPANIGRGSVTLTVPVRSR